jgi:hypothetical protein
VVDTYVSSIDARIRWGSLAALATVFLILNTDLPSMFRSRTERLLKRLFGEEPPPARSVASVFDEVQRKHPGWDRKALSRIRESIGERP